LRPSRSQIRPPISAPIPAAIAFELKAPRKETNELPNPKCSAQMGSATAPATIDPASM
jgi:hypothetical protein